MRIVGDVEVLDRPVLAAREAARQLRIPASTLLYWLEGARRGQVWRPPVLRDEPTGSRDMTWGEMVEARYLRAYRSRAVSMQRLRPFIKMLREEFGVPYPLAHFKPFVDSGRRLLLEAQEESHLPESMRMVYEVASGQLILDRRVDEYLERVDFADAGVREAVRLRPVGRESPVVMDPRIASGAATVAGVRTEVIAELADSEVSAQRIAEDFGLPVDAVKAAVAYEWAHAA